VLRFILPGIIWTIVIIVLSLIPNHNVNFNQVYFDGVDKIAHFSMYTFLTLFWSVGLKRQSVIPILRKKAFRICIIGGFVLSFLIEILQEFAVLTRHFEFYDLIANGFGCIFGVLIFKLIFRGSYK